MTWVLPDVDLFQLVTPPSQLPLAAWYAMPMGPAVAAELYTQARQAQQRQLVDQGNQFPARLAELIACYWLDRGIDLGYQSLLATASVEQQALVELVYGQLLISRKLAGAHEHLRRGFSLAIPLLQPAEYFAVLRCHEMLSALMLNSQPAVGQTLADLLKEARVIKQLQSNSGRMRSVHSDDDTLG